MGCVLIPIVLLSCVGFIVVPILYLLFCLRICQGPWAPRILVPALSTIIWFWAAAFLAPDTNGALPVYLDAWAPAFIVGFFLGLSHFTRPSPRTQKLALWSGISYPLVALVVAVLPPATFEGPYPFLREAPSVEALTGTYVPSVDSTGHLKAEGFDAGAKIVLKSDQTFEIQRLAHIGWFPSTITEKGYDSCTGKWWITQDDHRRYEIMLTITTFTPDSVFNSTDLFYNSFQHGGIPFPVGIAGPTSSRPDFALVLPLNAGDEGELIFDKQH